MATQEDWEAAASFADVAARFCALIDQPPASGLALIRQLGRLIPELIFRASQLPDVDAEDDGLLQRVRELEESQRRYESLKTLLGDLDLYWEVFDPTVQSEPIHGTVADDLAGIYTDLQAGLADVALNGGVTSEAVWDWRFTYESHWGHHAIDCLRTIHTQLYSHGLAEDA